MKDEYKEMVCRVRFIDGVIAKTYLSDVEIVRCKDCINRYSTCPMITFHSSGAIETITYRAQDDWWCCFGKRKEA